MVLHHGTWKFKQKRLTISIFLMIFIVHEIKLHLPSNRGAMDLSKNTGNVYGVIRTC